MSLAPILTVPWDFLCHDNHRLMPARGRLIKSTQYRARMHAAAQLLRLQWRGPALPAPVALVARLYFPDARKRDAGNYRKFLTDALTGIAYADDSDLWRETWERAGIDRAQPRVELTLEPLTTP